MLDIYKIRDWAYLLLRGQETIAEPERFKGTLRRAEYVHQNLELLIDSKKFKVDKYTLKELDSMNWVVKYPRNNKD